LFVQRRATTPHFEENHGKLLGKILQEFAVTYYDDVLTEVY